MSARPAGDGSDPHLHRPFSLTVIGIVTILVAAGTVTFLQPGSLRLGPFSVVAPDTALINRMGLTGSAVFTLAACAVLYRAVTSRSPAMVPIALLFVGPGAWWNWSLFFNGEPSAIAVSRSVTLAVLVSSAVVAACLLLEAGRHTRWLGLYCGLGSMALAAAATLVRLDPESTRTASLPLMMIVAGLACLYGTLVEIDAVRRRSLKELLKAKARTEGDIAQVEGALHGLRSGLRSIEAAIVSLDSEPVEPPRVNDVHGCEPPVGWRRRLGYVDLVPGLRDLANSRRPGGLVVELHLPASMIVRGDEGELLSVVDSLLSNVHRHEPTSIRLEAGELHGWNWVVVTGLRPRSDSGHSDVAHSDRCPDHARILAQKNGGRLRCNTTSDGATRFVLSLPIAARTQSQPPVDRPYRRSQQESVSRPFQPAREPRPVSEPPASTAAVGDESRPVGSAVGDGSTLQQAREPWTWPEPRSSRPTPPLPPPWMALRPGDDERPDLPETDEAVDGDSAVADQARQTIEIALDLRSPSEWFTAPLPTQVPDNPAVDIAEPQPTSIDAL